MGLILDNLNSFFKSEPAQLDIYGHTQKIIYDQPGKNHQYSLLCSLGLIIKKNLILMTETIKDLDEDENLDGKKIQCSRFCFISVGVLAVFLKNSYK